MELNQVEVTEVAEAVEAANELGQRELDCLQLALVGGGVGVATFG